MPESAAIAPGATIAVVGASTDRRKFGNKCVRAYASAGWEVFPVNLHEDEIEGLPVFRTLQDAGRVAAEEMDRVFNMGIGMIAVVDAGAAASVSAAAEAHGVESWTIGSVESGAGVRYL